MAKLFFCKWSLKRTQVNFVKTRFQICEEKVVRARTWSQQAPRQKQQPAATMQSTTTIILLLVHFALQVFTFEGGRMKALYYPSCNAFDRSFPCIEYSIFRIACSNLKGILKVQFLVHVENPFLECFWVNTFFNTVIFGKKQLMCERSFKAFLFYYLACFCVLYAAFCYFKALNWVVSFTILC